MLKRVTITGVDERTDLDRLLALSEKYPFVEWGILASMSGIKHNRYPGTDFLRDLSLKIAFRETPYMEHQTDWVHGDELAGHVLKPEKINTALHLCGGYARAILGYDRSPMAPLAFIWSTVGRIQINATDPEVAIPETALEALKKASMHGKDIIVQVGHDEAQQLRYEVLKGWGINVLRLHDVSGGQGILPKSRPVYTEYMGYAGGLGPDNIEQELKTIMLANTADFWVDMETRVRTNYSGVIGDDWLDLDKVERVLAICNTFIHPLAKLNKDA